MSIDTLRELIPAYAKDLSLNLSSLASEPHLSDQQKWGCFLACAHAKGQADTLRQIEVAASAILTPEALIAAKAASAIMGMNNIYYRALHLMESEDYATLRASLRMNILANPGVDKVDFELWALAVSAINGCGACLDSHEKVLRDHGLSTTQIQNGIRIAAVVSAVADVLRAEKAVL